MASFQDLAFDWSTLCQECPECWTTSVFMLSTIIYNIVSTLLPRPNFKNGPLCASNFETFSSKSRYFEAQKRDPSLKVLHKGKCKRLCQLYAPVCGSNKKTYHNICQLNYDKQNKKNLFYRYNGQCSNTEIKYQSKLSKKETIELKKKMMKLFEFSYYDLNEDDRLDNINKQKQCVFTN